MEREVTKESVVRGHHVYIQRSVAACHWTLIVKGLRRFCQEESERQDALNKVYLITMTFIRDNLYYRSIDMSPQGRGLANW